MKFNTSPGFLKIFQLLTTIIGIVYLILAPPTIINFLEIGLGYFLLSCIGNSIFYHRFISHKSFKTYKPIEYFGIICGMLAGRGSPIDWGGMHRYHHKHADTNLDPHNPEIEGWRLFFPHFLKYDNKISPFIVKDLLHSKFHRILSKYYVIFISMFALIFSIIDLNLCIYLWVIPVIITNFMLSLTVYVVHTWGYRNFETNDKSKNNWFISLLMWGEGWHNNHHHSPIDWKFQRRWWEIDIGSMIISIIKIN